MIRRITLENYMSHCHTVIEPAAGLTVLVGPNNCGKSAVLSAIQSVCGETASDYMVRHGEKSCRVTVETDDDHIIIWQRKGGTTSYTIDGTDIHRVGRGRNGLPDDLHTLLRMPIIESAAGKKFQVHFGSQKDPIFLLGSDSETAAFFSSSAESERLMEMQKRHKAKVAARRADHRAIEADLQQLDAKLKRLEPLAALAILVEQVEAEHRTVADAFQHADILADRIDRLSRLHRQIDRLTAEMRATSDLQPPPAQKDLLPLQMQIAEIERWRQEANRQRAVDEALTALQPPQQQIDPTPLAATVTTIERLRGTAERWLNLTAALDPLADPPELMETRPLETLGKALRAAQTDFARRAAIAAALEPLQDVPKQEDLTTLEADLIHLQRTNAGVTAASAELVSAEASIAEVEAAIVRYVTQHPLCPTCGGPLTASHVMHGGVAHVQS